MYLSGQFVWNKSCEIKAVQRYHQIKEKLSDVKRFCKSCCKQKFREEKGWLTGKRRFSRQYSKKATKVAIYPNVSRIDP
jgi:hypothetical protein